MIKTRGKTIPCEVHSLIISIWNKAELPEERKESIIVLSYKKGHKINFSNYRAISKTKLNSVALVRVRTIPTERPPPVGEVSANFCG